jgi:nucleotide-binding universal stress UspA family protein
MEMKVRTCQTWKKQPGWDERMKGCNIAIASHGRTGLPSVFYGSVAAGVLSRVERPLLLVRSREAE